MKKRLLFIVFLSIVLTIILIGFIYAETTNSDIISQIKKSSSGVIFSDNGFGGTLVKINSLDNKLVYRDLQGNLHEISGLLNNGQIELDSKGNIIKGNFVSSKSIDLVLGGNLKTSIPANSKLVGVDGRNFDITLAEGSGVATVPIELFPNQNLGNNLINYKLDKKSNIKFPDFIFQEGVISHNGRNFVIKGGNTAVIDRVSLYSLGKEGDNPIFFDEKKVPENLKNGYSVVDLKKMIIKNIGGDGKTQTIMIRPGNPIAPINENNKFGFKAGQEGQVSVQSKDTMIYPYVQGKFVMRNGNLYLYRQTSGLVGSLNNQNGNYDVVPIDISLYNEDGSALLKDKDGNALGLMIKQGKNGWPQIQTGLALSPENPNPLPQTEMPNWQHNPDNSPLPGPQFTLISTPQQNPSPSSAYPFTKTEFLRDIYSSKTKFPASLLAPNLGQLLQSVYPEVYNKHFARGSMTTIDETIADYKKLIEVESKKFGTNPGALAQTMKINQPALYKKYGKYFGF